MRSTRRRRGSRALHSTRAASNRIGPDVPSKTNRMIRLWVSRPPLAFMPASLRITNIINHPPVPSHPSKRGSAPLLSGDGPATGKGCLVSAVGTLDDVGDHREVLLGVGEADQPGLLRRPPKERKQLVHAELLRVHRGIMAGDGAGRHHQSGANHGHTFG